MAGPVKYKFVCLLIVLFIFTGSTSSLLWGQIHDVIKGQVANKDALSIAMPLNARSVDKAFFDVIFADLKRSSLFSLVDFKGDGPTNPRLGGSHLVPLGARYLVLFQIENSGTDMYVNGYLCSASETKPSFARRYKVSEPELDLCAHQFSDDLVESVTGRSGFASHRIAFVGDYNGNPAIFSVYPDGSRLKRLVSGPFLCLFPNYSPSRNWLIYTAYKRGFPEMFILDVNSAKNLSVQSKPGLNSFGAISPDGSTIAATLSFSGNPEIYLLSLTGKIKKQITKNRGCDLSPSWSSDGKRLAYVSDLSGEPHIYVVDVDSPDNFKRLTYSFNSGDYCVSPEWSPVNNDIAYISRSEQQYDIMLVNADTGNVRVVTKSSEQEESLDWAPDGRHLIVGCSVDGRGRLTIVDTVIDGERQDILLEGIETGVKSPSWSSVPN
jgi:TolB protein